MALIFDDGPHARYTGQFLDALAGEGVRATFFLQGDRLSHGTSEILTRADAEGHEVGNNTHRHLHFGSDR